MNIDSYFNQEINISNLSLLKRFWKYLSLKRKTQIKFLVILMLLAGISEIFSIGSLIPFLSALTDINKFSEITLFKEILNFIGFKNKDNLLFLITFIFLTAISLSTSVRLLNIWATGRLSAAIGIDLSSQAFERTLLKPYKFHLSNNTSEIIAAIGIQINLAITVLQCVLNMTAAIIILSFILISLFIINWGIATSILITFSIFYGFIRYFFRNKLEFNGKKIDLITKNQVKILNEGFGSIRELILSNKQNLYTNLFRENEKPLRILNAQNNFLSSSPRFIIEAFGIFLLVGIAYIFIVKSNNNFEVIPILGAIALGMQRILPNSQTIYSSWASIKSNKASLVSVLNLLDSNEDLLILDKADNIFQFREIVCFKNVSFKYGSNEDFILKDLSFSINKGERVGFIGSTGSGKTTTLDILMTLLKPTSGSVEIDGLNIFEKKHFMKMIKWRENIALVPQDIYLSDASIEENIAFGKSPNEIDYKMVKNAAKKAKVDAFISNLPNKYKTKVGERGARLSGGQIQRIAIARALYKNPDILIFDEGTSALDNLTEKKIMNSLDSLSKELTLIIIAHRLTAVANCDKIIEIEGGEIKNIFKGDDIQRKIDQRNHERK